MFACSQLLRSAWLCKPYLIDCDVYVKTEAFGTEKWSKHYCQYTKENRIFTMIPYTQTVGKIVSLKSRIVSMSSLTRLFILLDVIDVD